MRITYTSPVRGHQFRYAAEFMRMGVLSAHITGVSRWRRMGAYPELQGCVVRKDFFQTLYLACLKLRAPEALTSFLDNLSRASIDDAAYGPAQSSDVLLYYRTAGCRTAAKLRARGSGCLTVMEEVNTHVDCCHEILRDEYQKLGRGRYPFKFPDHELRLRAYDKADFILCPSTFVVQSFIKRGFAPERLIKNNFGFDLASYQPNPQTREAGKQDVFRLLYVGQLNFRKGLRYAIKAFRCLAHPRKELVLVGPTTKVTGLEDLAIPEGVKFAGVLKGTDLVQAYASATAFVLPTIEEGLALVLGEAMAAGLPVVTTTSSGGEDLIEDGVQGLIVPPADERALLEAFEKLSSSPSMTQEMGAAARRRAGELGDWGVAARRLVTQFERVLSARVGN